MVNSPLPVMSGVMELFFMRSGPLLLNLMEVLAMNRYRSAILYHFVKVNIQLQSIR